jgi:hypothetical protein
MMVNPQASPAAGFSLHSSTAVANSEFDVSQGSCKNEREKPDLQQRSALSHLKLRGHSET